VRCPCPAHGLAISRSASPTLEPLLSVAQVAKLTGRAVSTLEKDRLTGYGPRYVKLETQVRYRPADVRAWLSERVRRSTSDIGGEGA